MRVRLGRFETEAEEAQKTHQERKNRETKGNCCYQATFKLDIEKRWELSCDMAATGPYLSSVWFLIVIDAARREKDGATHHLRHVMCHHT